MTAIRYADPDLIYGAGAIYLGEWTAPAAAIVPTLHRGYAVEVFDSAGIRVALLSSDAGRARLGKTSFDLVPTGPGKLDVEILELPSGVTITHGTRLDVYLWGNTTPTWSGYAVKVPDSDSDGWPAKYSAVGYYSQLDRPLIDATYTNLQVWRILETLVRQYVEPATGILYAASQVQRDALNTGSSYVVQEIRFVGVTAKQAIEQLAGLAGGYEFGVDGQRTLFFRRPRTTVPDDSRLWAGPHVRSWVSDTDSSRIVNKLRVKSGRRSSSLDAFLPRPVEDLASQRTYGVRWGVATAPSAYTDIDAYRWASTQLAPDPAVHGDVKGITYSGALIDCAGRAVVTGRTGTRHTLQKKRIDYRLSGAGIEVDVQLGDRPQTGEEIIWELQAIQKRDELAQQLQNRQM